MHILPLGHLLLLPLLLMGAPPTAAAPRAAHQNPAGPPAPVLRTVGSPERVATRFLVGAERRRVLYVELDPTTLTTSLSHPGALLPTNLYAVPESRVALELVFDQPIDPSERNLARIRWEYEARGGRWAPLETHSTLLQPDAARPVVRVEPRGALPAGGRVRVTLQAGFTDAWGEVLPLPLQDFAVARTQPVSGGADELRFASPGDGGLAATRSDVVCSGGPGGNFDWYVRANELFLFDTTAAAIVGGPNGIPTSIQNSINGRVEVRDLVIEEGGTLRVTGPNPFRLCASGEVIIRGELNLSGFDAKDVATLNTANQPETGGAGGPGAGSGGSSSSNTTTSTPRGDTGAGPDGALAGGQGGESGFAARPLGKDARRPGGGGGGRFATDPASLASSSGKPGEARSTGAVTGLSPAQGGEPGSGPFIDGDPGNDFWGAKLLRDRSDAGAIVFGELRRLQGGYGGGGGGDAVPSPVFPPLNWTQASDEKGGPGGGGGGAGYIRAMGRIAFGLNSRVHAGGGDGATGENTLFLDHVGGSGGSGSGGMLAFESATQIDFTDGSPAAAPLREYVLADGGPVIKGATSPTSTPIPPCVSYGGAGGPGLIQLHLPAGAQRPSDDPSAGLVLPTAAFEQADPLSAIASPAPQVLLPIAPETSAATSAWVSTGAAGVGPDGAANALTFLFGGVDADGVVLTEAGRVTHGEPLVGPRPMTRGLRLGSDGVSVELTGGALGELRERGGTPFLAAPTLLEGAALQLVIGGKSIERRVVFASFDAHADVLSLQLAGEPYSLTAELRRSDRAPAVTLTPRYFGILSDGELDRLPAGASVRFAFQAVDDDGSGAPDERRVLVDWSGDPSRLNGLSGPLWLRVRSQIDLGSALYAADGTLTSVEVAFVRLPWTF